MDSDAMPPCSSPAIDLKASIGSVFSAAHLCPAGVAMSRREVRSRPIQRDRNCRMIALLLGM
jgi:hypothetical protein